MPWGFSFGDGWFDLIWNLSMRIDRHVRKQARGCQKCGHPRLAHPGEGGTNEKLAGPPSRGSRRWCKKCPVSIWSGCLSFKKPDLLDPMCTQAKEKFGGLRFYMGGATDSMIEEFIRQAEEQAEKTCEECGKPGKIAGTGWISTKCYDCRAAHSGKEYADEVEAAHAAEAEDLDDNDVGTEVG